MCYSRHDLQKLSDRQRGSIGRKACVVANVIADAAREKHSLLMARGAGFGDYNSLLNPESAAVHLENLFQSLTGPFHTVLESASIQFLNMFSCNLRSSSHPKLALVLERLPALLELNLSLNHLSGDCICPILQAAPTSLQTLIIRNTGVTASSFSSAQRPFDLNSLTHLDVSDNPDLLASGFVFMMQSCAASSLIHLRLSHCGIDLSSGQDLTSGARDHLRSVFAIFQCTTSLQLLDLSNNSLGAVAVEIILRAMSPDPQHFGRSKIANHTQQSLMPWQSPLRYLNISCTACHDVDPVYSRHFDKWLNSILVYFSNLTHFFLSGNQCILNVLSTVSHLTKLVCIDLSDCNNLLTISDALFLEAEGRSIDVNLNGCDDLEYPPKKVAEAGLPSIRQFISSTNKFETTSLRHVKVMVLGSTASCRNSFVRSLAHARGPEVKSFDEINQLIRDRHSSSKSWQQQLSLKVKDCRPNVSFWNLSEDVEALTLTNFYLSAHQTIYFILFNVADSHQALVQEISCFLRAIFDNGCFRHSIRIHLVGSDHNLAVPGFLDSRKHGIEEVIQNMFSAMGILAHYNSKCQVFLDWWYSGDPRFVPRMLDTIFSSSAELLDGPEILQFPVMYEHLLVEVKQLAHKCEETKSVPLIKLCDIPDIPDQGFKVLSGSHRNPRKLEAIKMCSDVGILIHFRDSREDDWICVNMNFGIEVAMSFINFTQRLKCSASPFNRCMLSKDDVHRIFTDVFQEFLSISWYASSVSLGYAAEALFAFFEAQKLILPSLSPSLEPDSEDGVLYLVPGLLRARPDDWWAVFGHLYSGQSVEGNAPVFPSLSPTIPAPFALGKFWSFGTSVRVKCARFVSSKSNFSLTSSKFLQIMLSKCHDYRHMWHASFMYHVDGVPIFVRLANDARAVDVITIAPLGHSVAAATQEAESIARALEMPDLQANFLCPRCCLSDHYIQTGTCRVFFEQQINHYKLHGLGVRCYAGHNLDACVLEEGEVVEMPAVPDPEAQFFPNTSSSSVPFV